MPRARRLRRLLVLPISALLGALVFAPGVAAADQEIASSGPLDQIIIGDQLNCQVAHVDDEDFEFYEPSTRLGDCGTFVVLGGVLYSPAQILAGPQAVGTPFTPVSQTLVTGAGTAADPYQIVTVVALGTTGVTLTETDSYVVGNEFYRTDILLTAGANVQETAVTIFRAGDCYLQNSDFGFGSVDTTAGAVRCVAAEDPTADPVVPGTRIEEWVPLTAGSTFYQARYSEVWDLIGAQTPFPNTCECDIFQDNGAGLSWQLTLPAAGTVTVSHLTNFSPQGASVVATPTPTPTPAPTGTPAPTATPAPTTAPLPDTSASGGPAPLTIAALATLIGSAATLALVARGRVAQRRR